MTGQMNKSVLGVNTEEKKQDRITVFWERIVSRYPEYSYSYLTLSSLYKKTNIKKSEIYLGVYEEKNPTF